MCMNGQCNQCGAKCSAPDVTKADKAAVKSKTRPGDQLPSPEVARKLAEEAVEKGARKRR